jgi:hypothetical protein
MIVQSGGPHSCYWALKGCSRKQTTGRGPNPARKEIQSSPRRSAVRNNAFCQCLRSKKLYTSLLVSRQQGTRNVDVSASCGAVLHYKQCPPQHKNCVTLGTVPWEPGDACSRSYCIPAFSFAIWKLRTTDTLHLTVARH